MFHPVFVRFEGAPVLADPQDSAAEALRDGRLWSISVGEDHHAVESAPAAGLHAGEPPS